MGTKNIGIYVHIPFCKQKCKYCDFKSYSGKDDLIEEYMKWLDIELKEIGQANKLDYENNIDDLINVRTIYIGGGTPSFIHHKYLVQIIKTIKENYKLDEKTEITIEVNPGTVNEEKLREYISCGINRISIGLQSTNEILLKQIGRIHSYEEFINTYQLARKVGFKNINVDLMIGLPNQTLENVKDSIEKILLLNPEHISVYSLILEEGTALYHEIEDKKLELLDEDLEREMYWLVKKKLERNGYEHYEISNFAKKGFESKHNLDCWNQEEYIGVGVAAHSYTNNVRYSNIEEIEKYINNYKEGNITDNFIFHEKQNKESKMKEYMLLGLRKIKGIRIQDFKSKFGENPIFIYRKELEKLVEEKLLEIDGDNIKLTDKGIDLANIVWEEFV